MLTKNCSLFIIINIHLGAEVFSRSMGKVASKYMLGLSATPKRKDGLSKVFEAFTQNND